MNFKVQIQPEANYPSEVTVFRRLTHTSIAWGTGLGLCNTQFCLASWIHCQCILLEDMASPQELTCLHPWWYKLKPIGSLKEQTSPFPSDIKEQEQSPLKYAPKATVLTKSTLKVSNLAVTPNASFVPSLRVEASFRSCYLYWLENPSDPFLLYL